MMKKDDEIGFMSTGSAYDNNGNVTKYIDESGSVVAAYEYDDFGRLISKSGPMADSFRIRFSTKYFDSETGLYYYGCRFYSPALMRWLNRDPIEEEGGLNLYGFVLNRPINKIDPFGLYKLRYHKFGTPPPGGWKTRIDAFFNATFRHPDVYRHTHPPGCVSYYFGMQNVGAGNATTGWTRLSDTSLRAIGCAGKME